MAKANITRARKARGSRRTERLITAAERDQAAQTLISAGQLDAVRAGYFCDNERNMPIAGTPRPKPCPFCGETNVSIAFEKQEDGQVWARVQCDDCGTQGREADGGCEGADTSSYGLALEAARLWNERKGGAA